MEKKIININDARKKIDDDIFFKMFCLGRVINLEYITADGVVKYHEYANHLPGIMIDGDFVTFDEEPKVYPIDLEMGEGTFYNDDQPGLYISNVFFFKNTKENNSLFKEYKEKFPIIEKWYFDCFLPNEIKGYDIDATELEKMDEYYKEFAKKDESEIIDFKMFKK